MKILYIDDDTVSIEIFKQNFRRFFDIKTAKNCVEAKKILEEEKDITIVMADMRMPNRSGLDLIKEFSEKYPDKKYFIITGYEVEKELADALNDGLLEHVFMKPLEVEQILFYFKKYANE